MLDPKDLRRTVVIENVAPVVDGGCYPIKREVGGTVDVEADVFKEGHEVLVAFVLYRRADESAWREAPMRFVDNDRWAGAFTVKDNTRYWYTIEALADPFRSWLADLGKRVDADQDVASELREGVALVRAAAGRATGRDATALTGYARRLEPAGGQAEAVAAARDEALASLMDRHLDRADATRAEREYEVIVDRERARFAAWYEFFPRSGVAGRHATFRDAEAQLERAAAMGFDVVYLPPIHPIGRAHRKGANNVLTAQPGEPGSPWAIGGVEGGHRSVHPDLGTIADVDALVAAARAVGIEIALDFAIQCSADHPWLTEHPEWFNRRPDGTLKYAENPPKKYQDIYNVNFDCDDWQGLWKALLAVVLYWVDHGIRVFRVDNPHTKPVPFWEWLIATVRARHPEVIFLAEAFTKRAMMKTLGKVGFNQSYTYFTWKSSRWELTEYVSELATSGEQEYFRPNFFVNTPDILTEELVLGGEAKFVSRLILAATLSPSYGVYSGYEHFEATPVRPGSEEYLDSEKYEAKRRALDGPLLPLIGQLNQIRRENPALQRFDDITFLNTENDALVAYAKRVEGNTILTVVSLDPTWPQEGTVLVPYELGTPPSFDVTDLLDGSSYHWQLGRNYVRLVPSERPAHILRLETP